MARATENRFRKSVGGSLKSLVGGKGRTYFMLENKTATEKFRAGQTTTFTSDYIELGRNASCAFQFGESNRTVSGVHAAIISEGGKYIIKNLSTTNPTLINGRPVAKQWFLNNGDEIQLSMEGPKIGFLTPNNNVVGSLPLSIRMQAFAREALRPYRQAVIALALILVALAALSAYFLMDLSGKNEKLVTANEALVAQVTENKRISDMRADSLRIVNEENAKLQKDMQGKIKKLERELKQQKNKPAPKPQPSNPGKPVPPPPPVSNNPGSSTTTKPVDLLQAVINDVYFIITDKVVIEDGSGSSEQVDFGWSGSGFLLKDGRFVTARHVIEPWYFLNQNSSELDIVINAVANNGGKVTAYFRAISPNGNEIKFNSSQFKTDRSGDEKSAIDYGGEELIIRIAPLNDGRDWTTYQSGKKGSIAHNNNKCNNLRMGDEIYVLGYPFGLSLQSSSKIQPMYSQSAVGQNGLTNNMINVTDRGFDTGNSGGPAFYISNGKVEAIGIVSAMTGAVGNLVPIAAAK